MKEKGNKQADEEDWTDESDVCLETPDFPRRGRTSLCLAVRAAVAQEDDVVDYVKHVLIIFRRSSTAIVCHTVLAILAICTFTIGVLQYGQCPYEPELPLFLVLHGTAVLVKTCLRVASSFHRRHAEDNERNTLDTINDVISVFVVLWTLTGSVWTFGILNLVDISNLEVSRYCDMLVFMTAFILLVFLYALFLAAVTGVIALIIYYKIQTRDNKSPLPYISHTTR